MWEKISRVVIGAPRNPLDSKTRQKIALTALLAWVGLGADGLSSSCYGPEQAFLALGKHTPLAFYLAIAIAITVFIISLAYNQVIELFPNGGGGYKVASILLGKYAGLVTGSALIVDYILTIVISIASGVDAVFSFLPLRLQEYKLELDAALIVLLIILNLRGMKESIKILLPIFIGFVITHFVLIGYGIFSHGNQLPHLVHKVVHESSLDVHRFGWLFVIGMFLHAYALGGGTYTGLEAVSNNVNMLAPPRVQTGKWTMFYMAVSLSVTAGGIILLYLLWNVQLVPGKTLNAIAFGNILSGWYFAHPMLIITLLFEAGLLFVSANTGFMGGPAVLANMAIDSWVPNRFRHLSGRLVKQNGVILFGVAALIILYASDGHVAYLVILYAINVFLAFTVSLVGLCNYWWKQRGKLSNWKRRLTLSGIGTIVCGGVLVMIVISRFLDGGVVALLTTGVVIVMCCFVMRYYTRMNNKLRIADELLIRKLKPIKKVEIAFKPGKPTAVFFVGNSSGSTMHTLLWAERLFPNHFKNYIFIAVGVIDSESYGGEEKLKQIRSEINERLNYFVEFNRQRGKAAKAIFAYGTDPVDKLVEVATEVQQDFPESVFFACNLVPDNDNWLSRKLHGETAFSVQRRLHIEGMQMIILPMKL